MILVVDFGSQVAHLIARKIRELNVYSELIPNNISIQSIRNLKPCGIILSGGPKSVYEENAPSIDSKILELNIPILGICYGYHLITKLLDGYVTKGKGEYGKTNILINDTSGLLKGCNEQETVWMSHADYIKQVPSGFEITSYSENNFVSSIENHKRRIYGVQFHPEVFHTPNGKKILKNFLEFAKCPKNWNLEDFAHTSIQKIKTQVGSSKVIMATSGGVDSTVAAELIHRAIGTNLHCVFVNNGLLRQNEFEEVSSFFKKSGFNFYTIDAIELFLKRLEGIIDPEEKRKIIGRTFIEVFETKAKELGNFDYLGQGTIYPDRIESAQPSNQASIIKSHHNVGGLPEKMNLKLLEPLKDLYKDEVRLLGKILAIDENLLKRHPFPGPGIAVRIVGEITAERLRITRESDKILSDELLKAGIYYDLWQSFTAFLNVQTVGVMGDTRTYQYPIVIRCVESTDAMTANAASIPIELLKRIGTRIANEVEGVNRVFYDLTDKPPATIEYE